MDFDIPSTKSPTKPLMDKQYFDTPAARAAMNRCLCEIGKSPLPKICKPKHVDQKIEKSH